MLIRDVLRRKGEHVVTVQPETLVADLVDTLATHNIGAVVVSTDGSSVQGIVSERDVVRGLRTRGHLLLNDTITTSDVVVAAPGDPVERLTLLMTERRIRHVPVVSGGRLVGIVSIGDVVKQRVEELESERENLVGYITGSR